MRRPTRERPKKTVTAAGEELLAMAERAGLDSECHDELRSMMFDWSSRFVLREAGREPSSPALDRALVALTVAYLRRIRRAS
jgi:hypothetical protein